jgi:hypothetical protein
VARTESELSRDISNGQPIPCVLIMIADEFGGEIPVGPFALIGWSAGYCARV